LTLAEDATSLQAFYANGAFQGDFPMGAIHLFVATRFAASASGAFALALLLSVMSGVALAQITGTVNPSPAPAGPSVKEDVPPGGCMPIGLTASGEIVFPIQCRELIERQRGKTVEQNPAAAEEKPAVKQSEGVVPEVSNPVINPVETVPLPKKRVEHAPRERASRPDDGDCQHFKSYDPGSGTYTGYDGQRRSCR
jgi:BA14K-like protein